VSTTSQRSFFDEVVAASGLSPVIAPFTLTRLLLRAGVREDGLGPTGLSQALTEIEDGLRVYLKPEQLEAAMARLRELAGRSA
jgi:hypothetical protein